MKRTPQMVVKLQISPLTNKGTPQALVYNRNRSVFWEGPVPDDLRYLLRKYPVKSYWYAHLDESRKVVLDARLLEDEEPEW